MRSLAICHPADPDLDLATVTIAGTPVATAAREIADPPFDPEEPANRSLVRLRVLAFSCNYRDRARIIALAQNIPPARFATFGSEFVALVEETGADVTRVRAGERVIGDNHYDMPFRLAQRDPARPIGIPSVQASRRSLLLHERAVVPVPSVMPDPVAAAFSLNAQTAYSMVRKLSPPPGAPILVTAGSSNTSLFLLSALCTRQAEVYVTTTCPRWIPRLRELGARAVFDVRRAPNALEEHAALRQAANAVGGFYAVCDPFFDLYLRQSLPLVAPGGRYITCGLERQGPNADGEGGSDPGEVAIAMQITLFRNLQLIGNCLGMSDDLALALRDYEAGRLPVVVDSAFGGEDAGPFLARTYTTADRFGKVVFRYD